jgi:hypothetical protein
MIGRARGLGGRRALVLLMKKVRTKRVASQRRGSIMR